MYVCTCEEASCVFSKQISDEIVLYIKKYTITRDTNYVCVCVCINKKIRRFEIRAEQDIILCILSIQSDLKLIK